jgi:serine/threonine protein kinase
MYSRQVAEAIKYLHGMKIVHSDVKLENVMVDPETEKCYLIDFGLSYAFKPSVFRVVFSGSSCYRSIEMLEETPFIGPEADIWALGVMYYCMVFGDYPFQGYSDAEVLKSIQRYRSVGKMTFPGEGSVDYMAKTLIEGMLRINRRLRFTIEQVCQHPWLRICQDVESSTSSPRPVRLKNSHSR